MGQQPNSGPPRSERIVIRVEPSFRDRVIAAAEARDGGNVSRLVRRAIERLLKEEE